MFAKGHTCQLGAAVRCQSADQAVKDQINAELLDLEHIPQPDKNGKAKGYQRPGKNGHRYIFKGGIGVALKHSEQ